MSTKRIIGLFNEEEQLVQAIEKIREKSLVIEEIFSPYPIHEALNAVGKNSRLPTAAYFLGLGAVASVLYFLYYTSVIDWPIMYGGKPFNSFPSFIVVTIVLTIFTITIGSLFFFSVAAKIFPGKKEKIVDVRITDDQFAMVLDVDENKINEIETVFRDCGAVEIR